MRARIKEVTNPFKEKIQALREQALSLAAEEEIIDTANGNA